MVSTTQYLTSRKPVDKMTSNSRVGVLVAHCSLYKGTYNTDAVKASCEDVGFRLMSRLRTLD